jgi:hypothetical protein
MVLVHQFIDDMPPPLSYYGINKPLASREALKNLLLEYNFYYTCENTFYRWNVSEQKYVYFEFFRNTDRVAYL